MAGTILHEEKSHSPQVRAAIYARVSTANTGQSPEMQLRELREYCERRGWKISGEYVDVGISGAKDRRPELDRLMADARRRKFDVIAVWRFDRFARSVRHLLRALDDFNEMRIDFVSLSEALDTSTSSGRMTFTVLAAVAELERNIIAERVRAGLRNARARGVRLGRPKVVADPDKINGLRDTGASWRAIGRELGVSAETCKKVAQKCSNKPSSALLVGVAESRVAQAGDAPFFTDNGLVAS